MYQNGIGPSVGASGAAGGLAMTGMPGNLVWLFLAGFAMIALGMAVWRTIPRREH